MTDSTAGNQARIAWPRLTRHINKHTQTELTWRHRHKAKVGGINYKKTKMEQQTNKTKKMGEMAKVLCLQRNTRSEVKKTLTLENQDVYHTDIMLVACKVLKQLINFRRAHTDFLSVSPLKKNRNKSSTSGQKRRSENMIFSRKKTCSQMSVSHVNYRNNISRVYR